MKDATSKTNGNDQIRLQKFLSVAGVCSRRQAERLIMDGRVKVDGLTVTRLGTKIDPQKQQVTLDGKDITPGKNKLYLALNKPAGVLTTLSDPYGRPSIADLLKGLPQRVYPVGRLDMDSEGLLLLTNDGELAYRLLHPAFKVPKIYLATVSGHPSVKNLSRLRSGIEIEPGRPTQPCSIHVIGRKKRQTILKVTLTEGRKRQIRLMFKAVGHDVIRLKRVAIGPLELENLGPGRYRALSARQINALKRAAGLKDGG